MFRIIVIIINLYLFLVSLSCTKYTELGKHNEIKDTCKIYGRLFLNDTLALSPSYLPQAKKKILLYPAGQQDEINYMYSATTDDIGYFTFSNLTEGNKYKLVYEETISGRLYRADTTIAAPFTGLQFLLKLSFIKQSGVFITVLGPNGQPVPKAVVCLFSNRQAFESGKCDNSNYTLTADALGRSSHFGLLPDKYLVLATATIGGVNYVAKDSLIVGTGVVDTSISFSAPPLPTTGGIQYTVLDVNGFPVNKAGVCMYLNPDAHKNGDCEGSNYSDSTNASGLVTFTGLENKLTFYTRAIFTIGGRQLIALDTVDIVAGQVRKDTMYLR